MYVLKARLRVRFFYAVFAEPMNFFARQCGESAAGAALTNLWINSQSSVFSVPDSHTNAAILTRPYWPKRAFKIRLSKDRVKREDQLRDPSLGC
ncbi:MAG: hypothetical protein ACJAYH_000531 [Celeribacter sp.]